ncbi:VOC family protein [Agrococcus jejuensis]|uniref:VOC family protein n=1 Tax=Agrococcus jejuensis TaxID=399736 RepID=UPI0011A4007E|nr:VOC family protein [Agrococcus jejuensis]
MLRGLANLNLVAEDMPAAVAWYADVLGAEPYFVRPEDGPVEYAEWRFGDDDDELALMSSAYRPALASPGGAVVSLHVDDVAASLAALVERGAAVFEPLIDRGGGFVTASIVDPFGNVLGLMRSPHWAAQHDG